MHGRSRVVPASSSVENDGAGWRAHPTYGKLLLPGRVLRLELDGAFGIGHRLGVPCRSEEHYAAHGVGRRLILGKGDRLVKGRDRLVQRAR